MKDKTLLPIGSIVRIGSDEKLLMITTRLPLTIENETTGYYDYGSCVYPIGIVVGEDPYVFNHEDITEILFTGFINAQEEKIQEYYLKNISSVKYPKLSIHD